MFGHSLDENIPGGKMGEKKRTDKKKESANNTRRFRHICNSGQLHFFHHHYLNFTFKFPENTLEKEYLRIPMSYQMMSFNCPNQHSLPQFLSLQKILIDLKCSGQKQGNIMELSKFKHKLA